MENCPLEKQGHQQIEVTWPRSLGKHGLRETSGPSFCYQGILLEELPVCVVSVQNRTYFYLSWWHRDLRVGNKPEHTSLLCSSMKAPPCEISFFPKAAVSSTHRSFSGLIHEHAVTSVTIPAQRNPELERKVPLGTLKAHLPPQMT